MITLWQLTSETVSGTQGKLVGSNIGHPVATLYLSPLAAILDCLASLGVAHPNELPVSARLLEIEVPAAEVLSAAVWQNDESEISLHESSRRWLHAGQALLLRVSSRLGANHYLLNTTHWHASHCRVLSECAYPFSQYTVALDRVLQPGADWLAQPDAQPSAEPPTA